MGEDRCQREELQVLQQLLLLPACTLPARITISPAPLPPSPLQGFMFGDKLLRPAMVKVSYSDQPSDSSADDAAASGASD